MLSYKSTGSVSLSILSVLVVALIQEFLLFRPLVLTSTLLTGRALFHVDFL